MNEKHCQPSNFKRQYSLLVVSAKTKMLKLKFKNSVVKYITEHFKAFHCCIHFLLFCASDIYKN